MVWIVLIIIVLLILYAISVYNSLVGLKQKVKNGWSQIDVQLQRRFDLIPNLVETVKGYMSHESDVLTKVAELRTSWANASTVSEKSKIDGELSGALKTIMAVAESYPDLKANSNFAQLQDELQNTEDKIAFSRQFYNDIATKYNTKLQVVPSNVIASMFHFEPEQLFEAENNEVRKNVKVDFEKNK